MVRALLRVVQGLHSQTAVQLLLVMALVESNFDPNQDRWWGLDLNPETRGVERSGTDN
ncbi:MAG: hypothetical protein OXF25_02230 [Cyanobacteria bacterium MAG CAR3_bin_5]|nr:hypothetical protein [Cyanobacteria bacterium MAG CAR3_bin_5]MCY4236065.1 hypothetical protein [Cyanobacteria bacterium MAG CAR2_bin_4]